MLIKPISDHSKIMVEPNLSSAVAKSLFASNMWILHLGLFVSFYVWF